MNKRILSLTLALVMVLGSFTAVFAEKATAEELAGKFLDEVGVLKGDEDGDLLLNNNLERRDAVVLLSRLLGVEDEAKAFETTDKMPTWKDARTDRYYVPFFAWAQTKEYFEGNEDNTFAPRKAITASEYSLVLLRALNYDVKGHDAWKEALETAKKAGLLEGVEVKANEDLLRGKMAIMTMNALKAKVQGSDKTLAEELGLTLPEAAVLTVEDVKATNLKEVEVKFSKAPHADSVENADNYKLNKDLQVESVKFDEATNTAIVLVKGQAKFAQNKEYELTIKNVTDGETKLDSKHKFVAVDNKAPEVVSVDGLGTRAIKVTLSEPVQKAERSNFKLDGKTLFGNVELNGREIFIRTFSDLTVGEHTLTVGELVDYNNFKVITANHNFEIVEDKDAPEIMDINATTKKVTVTFNEDIDSKSVNTKSAYWKLGSTKQYANAYKVLAGNKVEFTFSNANNELPLTTVDFVVNGIKDFSGNTMKEVTTSISADLDKTRPTVEKVDISKGKDSVVVTFDKELDKKSAEDTRNYRITDDKNNKVSVENATLNGKVVTLQLGKRLEDNKEYRLNIFGVMDNNKYGNIMVEYDDVLAAKQNVKPEIKEIGVAEKTIRVYFNKDMDVASIINPANYNIRIHNSKDNLDRIVSLSDITADINTNNSGDIAVIAYELEKDEKITEIFGLNLTDKDGNKINNFGKGFEITDDNVESKLQVKVTNDDKKEVEVKNTKEVVVEFTSAVANVDTNKVTISEPKAEIVDAKVSGSKVTLEVKDLKDNFKDVQVTFEEKSVLGRNDLNLDGNQVVTLINKVAPKIVKTTGETINNDKVKVNLVFNKEVIIKNTDAVKLTFVDIDGKETLLKVVEGYKLPEGANETIVLEVENLATENANVTGKIKVEVINSSEITTADSLLTVEGGVADILGASQQFEMKYVEPKPETDK